MTRISGLVLAGSVMLATDLAAAQNHPEPTTGEPERQDAPALARLIYPEALNGAITTYTIANIVTPTYHADPSLQALEADHPGIIDAMVAAMRPEFERARRDALPRLWAATSAVYAADLTPDELRRAMAFYTSPVGQRLALADQEAIAHAAPLTMPAGSGMADLRRGADPDDGRMREAFDATATGRKLIVLQPRIDAIMKAWNEERLPQADARITEAMSQAAARFEDLTPPSVRLTPTGKPHPSPRESGK